MTPAAPAEKVTVPATKLDIARSLITNHAAPGYRSFAAESAKLAGAMAELCGAPGPRRLEGARAAFIATVLSWQAVQHIRFGPAMVDDRHHRIEYWPDKHGQGEKQIRRLLANEPSIQIDAGSIATASVALQGVTVLERILFDEASSSLSEAQGDNATRCNLGLAVARNVAAMAKAIAEGWQRDYVAVAGSMDAIEATAILNDFFRSFSEQIEIINDLKIGAPLGRSSETARPRSAELWRSGLSERIVMVNLQALSELYSGPKTGATPGLGAIAAQSDDRVLSDLGQSVREGLSYGANFVEKHPELLGKALESKEGWDSALFLKLHLSGVREHAIEALTQSLDISLGFNSRDGD